MFASFLFILAFVMAILGGASFGVYEEKKKPASLGIGFGLILVAVIVAFGAGRI